MRMPRALWWSWWRGQFLMNEVPLYNAKSVKPRKPPLAPLKLAASGDLCLTDFFFFFITFKPRVE